MNDWRKVLRWKNTNAVIAMGSAVLWIVSATMVIYSWLYDKQNLLHLFFLVGIASWMLSAYSFIKIDRGYPKEK